MPPTPEIDNQSTPSNVRGVSRRSFIQTVGLSAAASAAAGQVEDALASGRQRRTSQDAATLGPDPFEIELRINGKAMRTTIDPATTLLEALRVQFRLTGSKEVCDRGACGGCTVLLDGTPVNSCMMLAADAMDTEITTIEGLANGDELDPLQEAFIRHDALQCGFCTPGLLLASRALLDGNAKPTLDEIKRGLSGNICRCGTYTNIFNAVLEASGQQPLVDPTVSVKTQLT